MFDRMRLAGFADEASDSIEGQVSALNELGWKNVELRTVSKKQICDLDNEEFAHAERVLKDNGISVCSLGSNIASWAQSILFPFDDTKELVAATLSRAKALGAKYIRIMSFSIITDQDGKVSSDQHEEERFMRLRWIVDEFDRNGITAVHENCFTYGGLSYEHTLKLIEKVPGLKLVFDTGNPPIDVDVRTSFPYKYQNSYEFYENVKPYIAHVHIKDSWKDDAGTEHYTFPGEGHGDVIAIVQGLESSGYTGFYSIEPHMEVVFHDKSKSSNASDRMNNFVSYGRKLEYILDSLS